MQQLFSAITVAAKQRGIGRPSPERVRSAYNAGFNLAGIAFAVFKETPLVEEAKRSLVGFLTDLNVSLPDIQWNKDQVLEQAQRCGSILASDMRNRYGLETGDAFWLGYYLSLGVYVSPPRDQLITQAQTLCTRLPVPGHLLEGIESWLRTPNPSQGAAQYVALVHELGDYFGVDYAWAQE